MTVYKIFTKAQLVIKMQISNRESVIILAKTSVINFNLTKNPPKNQQNSYLGLFPNKQYPKSAMYAGSM